ncbi:hypothetical protein PENTCL1PPCAC_27217, partial [Pristionchus entomophagus]
RSLRCTCGSRTEVDFFEGNRISMPNFVYYKDGSGVVNGPLRPSEAKTLLKVNFFFLDTVFRVVETKENEDFMSIDDLRSLNGVETPFETVETTKEEGKESKELIRVYKELTTALKERRSMQLELNEMGAGACKYEGAKKRLIDLFELAMKNCLKTRKSEDEGLFVITRVSDSSHYVAQFENNSPIGVRVMFGRRWDAKKSIVVESCCKEFLPGTGGKGLHIAPCISDDPEDGSEEVISYLDNFTKHWYTVTF